MVDIREELRGAMAASGSPSGRTGSRLHLLWKIGVSVLFGLAALGVSLVFDSHLPKEQIEGAAVSLFVGGLALITQFLIDVEARIKQVGTELGTFQQRFDEHIQDTAQLIRDEFNKIITSTELLELVQATDESKEEMAKLAQHSTLIGKAEPPLVFDFAVGEITRLSEYLRDLGRSGSITYDGEDRDWLLGLTRAARRTIDATSLSTVDAGNRSFVDGGLWTSDLGVHYLDAQREAIDRGLTIRRIFVIDRPDLQDDQDFNGVLQQHYDVGVKVRILKPNRITGTLRSSLFDFIVIDGALSYEATS